MSAQQRARLGLVRPSAAASTGEGAGQGTSTAARRIEEGDARLVVNMSPVLHRKLKIRAVERGVTMRDYVLQLLAADGLS